MKAYAKSTCFRRGHDFKVDGGRDHWFGHPVHCDRISQSAGANQHLFGTQHANRQNGMNP